MQLENLVTQNNHLLRLEYATEDDLKSVSTSLEITTFKQTLEDAFVYKRVLPTLNQSAMCLVGFLEGTSSSFHTSPILSFDESRNVVLTVNGSHYKVKNFVIGKPHDQLLMFICHKFHMEGIGETFGMMTFEFDPI
jgi:hypothetical protein